ncbi:hypothetical protein Taro_018898 [Colocasia esculenta]|uniref:At4g14310 8-bladed propeller domain-containing protein n=1 Tax=Colocasia esculenta TaxID=4460 RepID=A0A843V0G2_COLES|nr:hypothetical protein [Colocasia esculenta]
MSSRLKERGGGGGKVMGLKPQKGPPDGTPMGKVAPRRTPSAGKENPRRTPGIGKENPRFTPSNVKTAALGMRQRLLPADAHRVEKPAAAAAPPSVRWSTSSMPRGKASNPSDFARMLADLRAGDGGRSRVLRTSVSATDGGEKVKGRDLKVAECGERGSLGADRVVEKCQQPKRVTVLKSTATGKDNRALGASENCKPNGFLGLNLSRSGSRAQSAGSQGNGGKAVYKSVGVGYSTVMHSAVLDQKVSSEKEKESAKFLVDSSSNKVFTGMGLGKRNPDEVDPVEMCKQNVGFVSDSKSLHRQASDVNDALKNAKEKDAGELSSKFSGQVSLNSHDTKGSHKVDALVVNLKAELNAAAGETGFSETSTGDPKKDSHTSAEGNAKAFDSITVYENPSVQKPETGKVFPVVNRYSSKLHEKLAFLEGKVQRIASDIKRTKEMLEQNNPDASKLILSDIQNKISGIEKAVSHVMGATEVGELSSSIPVKDGILNVKYKEKHVQEEVGELRNSVKELNHEELEARFFPHNKLLRNRVSLTHPGEEDKSYKATLPALSRDPMVKNGSLSPVDEDSIALEFLASLNADKSKNNTHGKGVLFDSAAIQQMESQNATLSGDPCVSKNLISGGQDLAFTLISDEKIEEFEDQENKPVMVLREGTEDSNTDQLFEIGRKPSTGGWFVSEGEAVLLAHNDGSCSYFDIANDEEKAEYNPPVCTSNNLWGDCWLIRAPGVDGCSGRYVVAASAGNTLDSGFCSWDFYTKDVCAFRVEDVRSSSLSATSSLSRTVLAPLPNTALHRRNSLSTTPVLGSQQWWYRPCGPLLVSVSSRQTTVNAHDIRDGELVMTWEVRNPVTAMEYSSPLQWRSKGKLVIVEPEGISLWDVNSINPQPLLSLASGKMITALHVNNTDAELGGGVRQRISSSEIEGNDGVFCTQENLNLIDLRLPSGVGLKIPKPGFNGHSIFSRGDSIYLGCTETRLGAKGSPSSMLQQFSLRKGKLAASYSLPDNQAHIHHSSLTQVWGNYSHVMGICGMGLFVFDVVRNDGMPSFTVDPGNNMGIPEIIGPNDLYYPSFDYLGSRVLVISKDRPAMWRFML